MGPLQHGGIMLNFLFGGVGSKIKCLGEQGCMDFYDLSLEVSHSQIHPDSRGRNTDPHFSMEGVSKYLRLSFKTTPQSFLNSPTEHTLDFLPFPQVPSGLVVLTGLPALPPISQSASNY